MNSTRPTGLQHHNFNWRSNLILSSLAKAETAMRRGDLARAIHEIARAKGSARCLESRLRRR